MFPITVLLFFICLAWQRHQKRTKMKKQSSNKGLLVPWLLKALNDELYEGLRWSDIDRRIFYIHWTHKSAEQWSQSEIEVYQAWAAHKGKLNGKNEKQLKATFRCALNSKKELKEVYKTRRKRYWQFISPEIIPKKETSGKKGLKKCKETNNPQPPATLDIIPSQPAINLPSVCAPSSDDAEASRLALPPFESFCSFVPETPPYHANEITFNITGNTINHSPSPDRLTPPMDIPPINYHFPSSPNNFHRHDQDVYQPNYMTIPHIHQNPSRLSYMFNDFEDLSWMNQTDLNQKLFIDHSKTEFAERDQFVPAMEDSQNDFMYARQNNSQNKTANENIHSEITRLDDAFLLGSDVDQIACEMLIQELLTHPSETREYSDSV